MKSLLIPVCALLSSTPIMAVTYHEPSNEQILIRADKLPIDVDTMHWLANQLVIIAERENPGTAPQLRANAQLLTIAKHLDPENREAKRLNELLKNAEKYDTTSREQVSKATSQVWSLVRFLSSKQAGEEANLLSNCIKDVMLVVDPDHPSLAGFKPADARWKNTVATLQAFRETPAIASQESSDARVTDEPLEPIVSNTDHGKDFFEEDKPAENDTTPKMQGKWQATKLTLNLPVQEYGLVVNPNQHRNNISHIEVEIQPGKANHEEKLEIICSFKQHYGDENIKQMKLEIEQALSEKWGPLPNAKVTVRSRNLLSKINQNYLSSALIVLFDKNLSGDELNSNIFILAGISQDNKFVRTNDFWRILRSASSQDRSSRIIAPTTSEDDFRQLIALEKPEFFVHNEVILVDSLEDSNKFTGNELKDKAKEACDLFSEFQRVAESRAIGPLCANRHVRERLEKIVTLMPNHISAKMLLLQGSGSRPIKMERKYLAYELDDITQPVNRFTVRNQKFDTGSLQWRSSDLGAMSSSIEKELEQIKGYVDSSDKDLYDTVVDLATNLKNLNRASSRIKDNKDSSKSGYHMRVARNTFSEIQASYKALDLKIAEITDREPTDFNQGFKNK